MLWRPRKIASVAAQGHKVSKCRGRAVLERLEDRRLLSASVGAAFTDFYSQTNLVSDGAVSAKVTDPNLVNSWGLAATPTGTFRVADNGTGVSTQYTAAGTPVGTPVTIAKSVTNTDVATPTGVVRNDTQGFTFTVNGVTKRAKYLFASEDGSISAWNPAVNSTAATKVVDDSGSNVVFKGLTVGRVNGQPMLYAADFHNAHISVFNSSFQSVNLSGSFSDPNIPGGFAPFNIDRVGKRLFVTYAKQAGGAHDDQAGLGNGFVDEFTRQGVLVRRFATQGTLNSPWGMAVAPANFGKFAGALLVGNFGDGHINAYDLSSGTFLGQLETSTNTPLVIDGLWGLRTGTGVAGANRSIYFTAGPNGEANGLFGRLRPTKATTTAALAAANSSAGSTASGGTTDSAKDPSPCNSATSSVLA